MTPFDTKRLPAARDAIAPDGSDVRVLLGLPRGSMAQFELAPGQTSTAVAHRTVEEIWFFLSGRGEMWRAQNGQADMIVPVEAGVCLTIPLGTHFQFRSLGAEPLTALGVTLPPWPGDGEAVRAQGKWEATVIGSGFDQGSSVADVVSDIEQQIAKAWVDRDRSTIEAILAPEWSVTDTTGQVLTREQVLHETFGSTDRSIQAMVIDEVRVQTFGDTAVATGRTRAIGSYRGTSGSVVLRFTDVFVRRDGRWQVVASQGTASPQ